ncbi:MAG: capsid accessory protein [Podoviridae sp. cty5g4]|nr:MAG: capsid accessory protein [Podoviridae sp. cty5g4]
MNEPEMVSMKIVKKKKTDLIENENEWPYGLRLALDEEQVSKIPVLENLNTGDKVIICSEGHIMSKKYNESVDGDDWRTVEIQIEKISIKPKAIKKPENMNYEEYRLMRKSK